MLGGLGPMELIIILVIVLVLFGARRVPEIGASIGKGIREFKKATSDIGNDVREPLRDAMSNDRLPAGETRPMRADDEQVRPEPKRLI